MPAGSILAFNLPGAKKQQIFLNVNEYFTDKRNGLFLKKSMVSICKNILRSFFKSRKKLKKMCDKKCFTFKLCLVWKKYFIYLLDLKKMTAKNCNIWHHVFFEKKNDHIFCQSNIYLYRGYGFLKWITLKQLPAIWHRYIYLVQHNVYLSAPEELQHITIILNPCIELTLLTAQ